MQNSFKDHFKMLVRLSVFSTLATTLLWVGSSLILQLVSLFISPANSSIFQDVARLPIVTMNVVYHPLSSHFSKDKTSSLADQIAQRDSVFGSNSASVLAASDTLLNTPSVINFNIDAFFKENVLISKDASVEGTFTAPNITYNVRAGTGVTVTGGQNPVITNTGVTSLGGQTGAFTLGSNISLSNNTLSASFSGISSLSAGSGISVSGNEITNSDKGSSQSIFKNIAVSGQTSIAADSNNDTLTFVEGSGITITTDATNKKVTITKTSSAGGVTSLNSLAGDLTIAGGGINSVSALGTTVTVTGTEADTLATVTGRGATTATASIFNGGLTTTTLSATSISGYTLTGNITGSGSPILSGLGTINGATLSGGTLTGGTYTNTGLIVTGNYTATVVNTGSFTVSDGTNTIFSLSDAGTVGNISNVGTLGLSGAITGATASNTINGLIINSGALSGITGYSQTSGTFSAAGNTISLNANSNNNTNINTGTSTGTVTIGGGSATVDIALGSDATGDMYYRNSSGHLTRLAIGSGSQVLSVSGSIPSWVTGSGTLCSDCLINDPTSTQIIAPTGAATTGLAIRQTTTGSPTADIFYVSDNASSTKYLRVDSTGAVILGAGSSTGVFTVSPASTDPIAISPVAQGSNSYTGTITSADLTAARTWTFPNVTGGVCLDTGNCAGTGSNLGGSGSTNYISKWTGTYALGNSLLYDDGTNVGIGTTSATGKLNVLATTEQLRLSYNAGNYTSFTTNASGYLNIAASGSRVGINTLPDYPLDVNGTDGSITLNVFGTIASRSTGFGGELDLYKGNDVGTISYSGPTGGLVLNSLSGGFLDLYTANARAIRINGLQNVGIGTSVPATRFDVSGLTINTDADNTIGIANFSNTLTKDDSNTRTFVGVQIKPTLNAGASNASTTLNILNIDTTNTVTTGITTNLVKASYGGVPVFTLGSGGNITSATGSKWMPVSDSTSALNIAKSDGTSFVILDTTNSRVGIGTAPGSYALNVAGSPGNVNFGGYAYAWHFAVSTGGCYLLDSSVGKFCSDGSYNSVLSGGGAATTRHLIFTMQNNSTLTSGDFPITEINGTLAPTSGTATFAGLTLDPTINQTGGANGISRGIYINPTLTAAADFRALEIANNSGKAIYQTGANATNYFAGNVGIGTTAPGDKLVVIGNISSPDGSYAYSERFGTGAVATGNYATTFGGNATSSNTQTTAVGAYSTASGYRSTVLGYSATSAYTTSIALGFNSTTTADSQFVASSISDVYFGSGVTNGTPTAYTINGSGASGSDIAGAALTLAGGKATGNAAGGALIFSTSAVGSSGSTLQSLAERMRIDNSGNVGIGTTVPGQKLEINGNLKFTAAESSIIANNALLIDTGATAKLRLLGSTNDVYMQNTTSAGNMYFTGSSAANLTGKMIFQTTGGIVLGAGEGASPVALTVRGPAGVGSNIVGTDLTFDASNGTGTGGSGDFIFRTAPVAASSSTANTLADVFHISKSGSIGIRSSTPGSNAAGLYIPWISGDTAATLNVGSFGSANQIAISANTSTADAISANNSTSGNAINALSRGGTPLLLRTNNNSITNTVKDMAAFDMQGCCTPVTAGVGAGLLVRIYDAANARRDASRMSTIFTDTGTSTYTSAITFQTANNGAALAEVMRMQGNGNVGIGTTSPSYKLDILETASARGLNVSNTYATGSTYGAYISKTGAATTNTGLYVSSTGATTNYALESVGRIKSYEGSVGAPGGSWATFHFAKTDDPVLLLEDVGNGIGTLAQTGTITVVGAQSIMSFKTGIDFTNGPLGSGSEVFRIHSNGYIGIGTTAPATKLDVTGLTLNTDADATVGAANFTTTITKNDSNTRTFYGLQVKPTLNTGASNTNTTFKVLNIDTTNTAITGLTTRLIEASYGGSPKFVLDSGGSGLFYGSLQIPNGGYLSPYGSASAAGTDLTIGSVFSLSNTSGTLVGVQTGSGAWNPASGAGKFVAFNVAPTINQSGSASGDYTALQVNATETSALGTNKYLADFQTGGISKMVITSTGRLGIGKTNPGVALDVVGAGTFSSTLTATSGFTMTNGALSMTASSGSVALTLSSSATAFNVNSGLFDIDTSANRVGIGTSAPGDTLDVMGTVRIDSDLKFLNSGSTMHMAEGNDDAQFDIRMSSSSAGCNTGEAKGIVFKDNTGSQLGHICNDGGALAIFANGFVNSATDVAENYSDAADALSAGDVVALDAATFKGVKKSERGYQNTVLGVVSTEPGVLLSDIKENGAVTNLVHPKPVALSGRVPVKVSTENGVIQKGDFLTSSTTPGVAMKATRAGQMIGKALENYSGQGEGRILVYVSTTYADPSDLLANLHLDENGYLIPEGGTGPQSPGGGGAAGEQAVAAVNSRVDTLSAQVENILATQQQDHVTVTDDHQNIASLSASLHQAISDIDFLKTQLNIASIGAVLGQSTATDSASFSNLLVGENANLNNVSVLGTFNQGLLSINGIDVINGVTGASINTAVGPLRLQSTALAPIEFEGAKITMTPDGSIKAEEITVKKLKIDTTNAAAATLGEGTLAAGTTSITINTTAVTANSQIFITPKKKLSAPLAVTSQLNGTSFTVEVDTAPATDTPFSWLIIDTH